MLVSIDGQDVTEAIRDTDLTAKVRYAAAAPRVRERLVAMQRAFAARHAKIVTEGRDQGTVVFPDAQVKFYLTADAAERARRRKAELQAKGAGGLGADPPGHRVAGRATRTAPSGRSSRRRTRSSSTRPA